MKLPTYLMYMMVLLVSSFTCLHAQADFSYAMPRFAQLRNELLLANPPAAERLKQVTEKLPSSLASSRSFYDFVNYLSRKPDIDSTESMLRKASRKYPTMSFLKTLTEEDLHVIHENRKLISFILEGVLEFEYPYVINKHPSFLTELEFYNISPGEVVGEIGAGNGMFSLVTSMVHDSISYYINELGANTVNSTANRHQLYKKYIASNNLSYIIGEEKHTNLKIGSCDKIIVRNTFHHFKKKKQMLKSISQSLKEEGELLLLEPDLSLVKDNQVCKKAIKINKVVSAVENAGFKLVGKQHINHHYIAMRFVRE